MSAAAELGVAPTVGIVGAGVIGPLIATACAAAGMPVRLTDSDPARLTDTAWFGDGMAIVSDIDGLAGCDVLVEAVTEDLEVKLGVLRAVSASHVVAAGTLIATTTSAFTVTELSREVEHPERFVGLHVLATSAGIKLAEIAAGEHTSATAALACDDFAQALGLTALRVADRPGRLTRRLLTAFVNQAVQALDDGVADAASIDLVAELGLGHRRGPLAVLEQAGIADHVRAARATHAALADPALAPPALLARLAAAGDGRGFDFTHNDENRNLS